MTRKRFIKIMQSKGLQRNDANFFARSLRKTGLSYEIVSKGTVTDYGKGFFIVRFSDVQALMCNRNSKKHISRVAAYRSPPAISSGTYTMAASNISFNHFGDGKPIDEKGKLLKQEICNGGNR